jgi:phosphohistidine phosphatase
LNLILWRHAEAEDGPADLARELTPHGRKQAARVAHWLATALPERYLLVSSPAVRTLQTAGALRQPDRIEARIAPGAGADEVLAAVQWPQGPAESHGTVVLVGHQPTLGVVAARLLSGRDLYWAVRKGACWWLSVREPDGEASVALRAVVDPALLKR